MVTGEQRSAGTCQHMGVPYLLWFFPLRESFSHLRAFPLARPFPRFSPATFPSCLIGFCGILLPWNQHISRAAETVDWRSRWHGVLSRRHGARKVRCFTAPLAHTALSNPFPCTNGRRGSAATATGLSAIAPSSFPTCPRSACANTHTARAPLSLYLFTRASSSPLAQLYHLLTRSHCLTRRHSPPPH